jgi:DHA1 family multidrug resistance protein-like MFS transporter
VGNAIQALGVQFFIPILPIYLNFRGASSQLIGLTMAAGIFGYGASQFPAGIVADRFDRRTVMLVGMITYGGLYLVYLLPLPVWSFLVIRFLHAASGGVYSPASAALLADMAPPERRSETFGRWQASTRLGFLLGPLLGGATAGLGLRSVFVGAFVACILAAIPILLLRRRPALVTVASAAQLAPPAPALVKGVLPSVLAGGATDYVTGCFTAVWTLLLIAHGAETWLIGVSFTLFALPGVLFSSLFGRLVDRRGSRGPLLATLLATGVIAPVCALATALPALLALGFAEGVATIGGRPAVTAEVSRDFGPNYQARAQGLLQMGLLMFNTLGALVSGLVFGISPLLAFTTVTAVCVVSMLAAPRLRTYSANPPPSAA